MPLIASPLRSPRRRRQLLSLLLFSIIAFTVYHFRAESQDFFKSLQKGHSENKNAPGSALWGDSIMGGRWDQQKVPEPKKITNLTAHGYYFKPGTPKPLGQAYTKTVVVGHKLSEDVSWLTDIFPPDGDINTVIYSVDDSAALLRPPKNKGHEAMVYLSYVIDHYDSLADVNIFIHAHRQAWHTNELLSHDAVQVISRLSSDRVQREGYMNLRCQWDPGCPAWMHPGNIEENPNKLEQTYLASAWTDLFPGNETPPVLAAACCAQFAVSRDRIRSLEKAQYVFYRDWLLKTSLSDAITGRIWEWIWGYLFTGQEVLCPNEHVCYCDGFGVCFGGVEKYDKWWRKMWEKRGMEDRLTVWNETKERMAPGGEKLGNELSAKISELDQWLKTELDAAKERGNHPENRAKELT